MSLRSQVLQGGFYLAVRQALGLVLGLGGVLVLTRLIGPANYGVYAAALGVFTYAQGLSQWGLNVYLVRREGEEQADAYHQAFTLLLLQGLAGAGLAVALLPFMAAWTGLPGISSVMLVMMLGLPLTVVGQVALAQLERRLDYRRVALIDLAGQLTYYLVALPTAAWGRGVWAPVAGWCAQQSLLAGLQFWSAGYRPRLVWQRERIRQMWGYGLGYSSSIWVWQLRALVNPLVVGRIAGAEAVGFVALAIRVVEALSFVKAATWRLSIAALSHMQGDRERLARAVSEGMRLQLLALGPVLVGFGWVAPWVLPGAFGAHWTSVLRIFPFVALSYLANAMFNLHSSALYSLGRNWVVTAFHAVHIALFVGGALVLIPRWGVSGYGAAEIVALPAYFAIHTFFRTYVGRPNYLLPAAWLTAFGLALFAHLQGWWVVLGLVAVALWPSTWAELSTLVVSLKGIRRAAQASR